MHLCITKFFVKIRGSAVTIREYHSIDIMSHIFLNIIVNNKFLINKETEMIFSDKRFKCSCIRIHILIRGVRELEYIGDQMIVLENFENPAAVSRTTLQYCITAYEICKYTVQFLLPVKLLETRILRVV